ncbi:MAG TPA: glycosyl hydrolase, partial [Clostridiales bacterium]|nr:glycosyl hydrolase [Clostridiales bacterium]
DSFQMGAITDYYSADEAAVQAILAGADMVLMPDDFYVAYQGVTEAVYSGRISEERLDESVLRIIQTKLDQGIM